MFPRFAAHFRLEPGADPMAAASAVFRHVEDWVEDVVDRGPLELPVAGGTIEPVHGSRVSLRLDDDRGGWTLVFRREEAGAGVETKVRLRVGEAGLDFGLLEAGEREPAWRFVEPPEFVWDLLEAYDGRVGSIELPGGATVLPAPAVEDFVEELLLEPDRSVPFVAISQDDYLGRPLVDPEEIVSRLAGLARVFVLQDKSASYALTRALGDKELGCYMGAVRLYLPGFSPEGNPREHLLLLPKKLRYMAGRGGSVAEVLLAEAMSRFPAWFPGGGVLGELIAQTGLRPPKVGAEPPREPERRTEPAPAEEEEGPSAKVVRLAVVRRPPPEPAEKPLTAVGLLPRLREVMEENRVLFERNEELEDAIQEAIGERELYAEEVQNLEARLAAEGDARLDLEARLEEAEREAADLRFVVDKLKSEHPELFEEEPKTVLEALCRIASLEDPALVFLPSAYASAEDSPYRDPAKVLSALRALAEVAARRRKAAETGAGIGQWPTQLFESRGIRYAHHNTPNTKARWASEYRVMYEGRRVDLDEHITLGSSRDPAACLRIYFFWDPDKRTTVVAHVGRHKRNTLT